jgi:hypothetical protein
MQDSAGSVRKRKKILLVFPVPESKARRREKNFQRSKQIDPIGRVIESQESSKPWSRATQQKRQQV